MPRLLTCSSWRALAALLLVAVGLTLAARAEANPMLAPRAAGSPAAEAPPPPAEPGLLAPVARVAVGFQREANRRIAEQMRAIRDGKATGALLTGLMLAFAYGAVHAAGPGHGKLVVVTYFLSREARIGRGLLMGAQIALAHVVSAVVIVTFADLLLRRAFGGVPAEIPAVRAASYGLIFLVGTAMLARAIRAARRPGEAAHHTDHDHHGHEHGHACGCGPRPRGEGGLLSLAVGLIPCTGSVLILLYAFANDILWAGLLLVGMVALGMAVTMGALGLLSVLARRLVVARLAGGGTRVLAAVEILGATLVAGLGLALLATAV